MSYSVDTGTQKYQEPVNELEQERPAKTVFDSEGSSYSVDTGTQKYFNSADRLTQSRPEEYVFEVSAVTPTPAFKPRIVIY